MEKIKPSLEYRVKYEDYIEFSFLSYSYRPLTEAKKLLRYYILRVTNHPEVVPRKETRPRDLRVGRAPNTVAALVVKTFPYMLFE